VGRDNGVNGLEGRLPMLQSGMSLIAEPLTDRRSR
jgi:hypothetical protein